MTQAGDNGMSVDWSRPIEAVHDDGRVVSAAILHEDSGELPWFVKFGTGQELWVYDSGRVAGTQWRIRNVAQPATTPDELTKRMEAHLRNVVAKFSDVAEGGNPELDEARAIVALLPAPVDPDEAEAREIAKGMILSNDSIVTYDRITRLCGTAIKRGRALERGEG